MLSASIATRRPLPRGCACGCHSAPFPSISSGKVFEQDQIQLTLEGLIFTAPRMSAANAYVNRERAASSPMPRCAGRRARPGPAGRSLHRGALDVIGEDFQLRRAVDQCALRQEQVFVGLLGVRFSESFRAHGDPAGENAARLVVENALVELPAVAVGFGMDNGGVVVHVLAAAGDIRGRSA